MKFRLAVSRPRVDLRYPAPYKPQHTRRYFFRVACWMLVALAIDRSIAAVISALEFEEMQAQQDADLLVRAIFCHEIPDA